MDGRGRARPSCGGNMVVVMVVGEARRRRPRGDHFTSKAVKMNTKRYTRSMNIMMISSRNLSRRILYRIYSVSRCLACTVLLAIHSTRRVTRAVMCSIVADGADVQLFITQLRHGADVQLRV
jgi:hypothetical protein